jgi:hypothetical protein
MASVATIKGRLAVLNGIASKVSFAISAGHTSLFYATYIDQAALYINVYAQYYITACLINLGWEMITKDGAVLVPISPSTVNDMSKSHSPLDPV